MAKLNEILSTKEILVILAAMESGADAYETESNRTCFPFIRRELITRAKIARAVRGRIQNLAA